MVDVFTMLPITPLQSMQAFSAVDTRAASQYSQVSIACSVTSLMIGVLIQLIILAWGSFLLVGMIYSTLTNSPSLYTIEMPLFVPFMTLIVASNIATLLVLYKSCLLYV